MDKNDIDIEMGKKFNSAAAFVTGASQYGNTKISQSDQLKLYGFYKQSTCFGDFASTLKPSFWNFAATRKYWAWEALSNLTKYQAMSGYVELVKSILPKWKYDPKAANNSTNPMTKSVSKYISEDAKEEDKLDKLFALARNGSKARYDVGSLLPNFLL